MKTKTNSNASVILKKFTVVAIYDDNAQRYATGTECATLEEAAAEAIISAKEDNHCPEQTITLCAIFEGAYQAQDINVSQSDERPDYEASRAKAKPFTIVGNCGETGHVMAPTGTLAEYNNCGEDEIVAGVFSGHLRNFLEDLDWSQVEKLTREYAKA